MSPVLDKESKTTGKAASSHWVVLKLKDYKRLVGRMRFLEKHPVGNGYSLRSIQQDDKLQDLHRQLRGMPSSLYLTEREQRLEATAHAYLERYPLGTKSQLREVQGLQGSSAGDERLLRELEGKIHKVLEARIGYTADAGGIQGVIDRVSELQDLQREVELIDRSLDTLAEYRPEYSRLLRLRYIEGRSVDEVAGEFCIARKTFDRWRAKAVEEYARLAGE
ncbi:ECF-type sigma factor [Paenibacillus puerhi]|uniref:ECF-type sigma factor n=1 Tax=Paenibacillus puerhi TaxID=2692622 RepID=UPI0013590A9A|nr:ECF-type sigma factor [Paenibacillus puerhi]